MKHDGSKKAVIINDFTFGSILHKMFRFSMPLMFSYALQVAYSIVDMIVIGKVVGSAGLSAVFIASQIILFMTMLSVGFSTGGQVYIAQLIGAGKQDELNNTIGTLFSVVEVMAVCMTVLGFALHRLVLNLLNTPQESYDMAVDYMLICSAGMIFTYGYNMISAAMRGMGDSKHPFIFIMIASVINLILDVAFVAFMGMGAAGAALATMLGQAFSFIYSMFFLYKNRQAFMFDFRLRRFQPDRRVCRAVALLGIPFALECCAINISMMFVNSLVNQVGIYASAVFGVGIKIEDIANRTNTAITNAASAMVGQNIAAGKIKRIYRIVFCAWFFSGLAYIIFTIFCLIWGKQMFAMFSNDSGVVELAPVFISAVVWSFPAMVSMRGTNGLIQGIGNAKLSLCIAIFDGLLLRTSFSYILGVVSGLGLYGFFLGYGLAAYGTSVPGLIYFIARHWKKRVLVTEE